MKNSTELGARKILFLSLARRVVLGKLMDLAGTRFYYLENRNNNSYFTVLFHLLTHSKNAYGQSLYARHCAGCRQYTKR